MDETIALIFDILKFTVPALLAIGAAYLVFQHTYRAQALQSRQELRRQWFSTMLPLRIAAHERAVLYLERIHPVALVERLPPANLNADIYRKALLEMVEEEYEHNVVQQMYVSDESWAALLSAKQEVRAIIEAAADQAPKGAGALGVAQVILAFVKEKANELHLHQAKSLIKQDVMRMFP